MSAARRGRPTFGPLAPPSRHGALFAAVALAAFAAVGLALLSQHVYGMEPCPWCVLQRIVFVAIGAFALLGVAWRGAAGARVAGLWPCCWPRPASALRCGSTSSPPARPRAT
jgi:hypothetical protein